MKKYEKLVINDSLINLTDKLSGPLDNLIKSLQDFKELYKSYDSLWIDETYYYYDAEIFLMVLDWKPMKNLINE